MQNPVANAVLEYDDLEGRSVVVEIAIYGPHRPDRKRWRCTVAMKGIHERLAHVAGEDSLQALCLALDLVRTRLASLIDGGGRLRIRQSNKPFDLDRYFPPYQFHKELLPKPRSRGY